MKNSFVLDGRYQFLQPIGKGAYGTVACALDRLSHQKVAIKRVSNLCNPLIAVRTLREIKLLKHFTNTNHIPTLLDVVALNNEVFLVSELFHCDLAYIINSKQLLTIEHVKTLARQLFQALDTVHKAGVIHRDVKPSNILVNSDCTLKLADFGLAREPAQDLTMYVQTRFYRPPELIFDTRSYDEKIDLWGAGCCIAELFTKRPLFLGSDSEQVGHSILKIVGGPSYSFAVLQAHRHRDVLLAKVGSHGELHKILSGVPDEAFDMIQKLLSFDPETRMSASEALNHQFLLREYFFLELSEPIESFKGSGGKIDSLVNNLNDLGMEEFTKIKRESPKFSKNKKLIEVMKRQQIPVDSPKLSDKEVLIQVIKEQIISMRQINFDKLSLNTHKEPNSDKHSIHHKRKSKVERIVTEGEPRNGIPSKIENSKINEFLNNLENQINNQNEPSKSEDNSSLNHPELNKSNSQTYIDFETTNKIMQNSEIKNVILACNELEKSIEKSQNNPSITTLSDVSKPYQKINSNSKNTIKKFIDTVDSNLPLEEVRKAIFAEAGQIYNIEPVADIRDPNILSGAK